MTLDRRLTGRMGVLLASVALSIGAVFGPALTHAQSQIAIGFVWQTPDDPALREAEARAIELGVGFRSCGGWDPTIMHACTEDLLATGISGLLVAPGVSSILGPSIDLARAVGVPVITIPEAYEEGYALGRWSAARFTEPSTLSIGLLLPPLAMTDPADTARANGVTAGFGARRVEQGASDDTPEAFAAAARALLAAHADLAVVYAANERAATGASEAIGAAGRAGDITIIGHGGCGGVSLLEAGRVGALALSDAPRRSVDALVYGDSQPPIGLITDMPMPGVDSRDSGWGAANCSW